MVWAPVSVGPSFRVRVSSEGRPVKGLALKINDDQVVTDADGLVFLRKKPGSYFISVDHDDSWGNGIAIEVKTDGPAYVTLPLNWPSISPLMIRSLKGTLHFADVPGRPAPRVGVDLLEGLSGRYLKSAQTTNNAGFDFGDTLPGLYFLRVDEPDKGLIAVVVDPNAPQDRLDLELISTGCGLAYSDRIHCSTGDLYIHQLCGQVVDATGASIAEASISLYDLGATPKLIQQTRADGLGNFSMPTTVTGIYDLIIRSSGFNTLRRQVHIEANDQPACSRPLKVKLGIFGDCSTVQ